MVDKYEQGLKQQFCEKCINKFLKDKQNLKYLNNNFENKCKIKLINTTFYSEVCPMCRKEGECLSCGKILK